MVPVNASECSSSGSRLYRNLWLFVLSGLVVILGLTGCNFAASPGSDSPSNSSEIRRGELKTDISPESERDLARPPGEGFSVNPVALNTNSTQGEMQPARGLNTKRLFSESLRDDSARFVRLESAVQTIRDELDKLSPSINRLVAVEEDIQELVTQLNTLVRGEGQTGRQEDEISVSQLENTPDAINRAMGAGDAGGVAGTDSAAGFAEGAEQNGMTGTPQPSSSSTPAANNQPLQIAPPPPMADNAPAPAGQSPPSQAPPEPGAGGVTESRTGTPQFPPAAPVRPPDPPVQGPPPLPAEAATRTDATPGQPQLANIRMADNAGKTRIVMEASGPMTYSADLDNSENILTLIFPAGTSIDPSSLPTRSSIVKSVTYTPQESGGFVLAFTLTKGSKILTQGNIGPNADNTHHRLYIDLAN